MGACSGCENRVLIFPYERAPFIGLGRVLYFCPGDYDPLDQCAGITEACGDKR
jgi:hypothetical protein